jgi:23S rRNA U2552 (ribose-2'-O)-methylase RlmE/FtsJ
MELKMLHEKRELLGGMKKHIDHRIEEWEQIKHDINPLEFVYTFVKGESVSKITPVSRAFFKMIEMMDILNEIPLKPIRTLHIAESPGGFIQAINWKRRTLGMIDYNMGWTLRKENAWKKLEDISKTWSTKPILRFSDLLKEDDRQNIIRSHVNTKAFFVTGDGGFDFSSDYEHQETSALPLILAQCVVGLECLEKDGVFILKIFDCFTLPTLQILWVFWKVFKGFRVIKPSTSRACNSEKYIVARGFKGICDNLRIFLNNCKRILKNREERSEDFLIETLFEEGRASKWDTMEDEFKNNFMNVIGGMIDTQANWIERGLNKYKIPDDEKIRLAKEWCRKYRIPISNDYYESHPMNENSAKTDWQENHRHFSLHRRLTSVSPPLCD